MHEIITRVWVEAILDLPVAEDGDDPYGDAARHAMPGGAQIVTAVGLDDVDRIMSQEAADMRDAVDECCRQLRVVIGALDGGISDVDQAASMVRNVLTALTAAIPPTLEVTT